MKIIFDLRKVGLGNNGGSSTLIKSGNALVEMGHDVFFVDSMKNQHTWTPLKAKHIIPKTEGRIPDADFIIATGYKSVGPTCKAPDRCGRKVHYIRGWETWQMNEKQIVERILKVPTIKLVNGIGLQEKLKKYGFASHIIRPGYDFDEIYPTHYRDSKKGIIVGGIYLSGVRGNRKRTEWMFITVRKLKTKYKDVKFWLFGNEASPPNHIVDNYVKRPNAKEKNKFYNSIDIWMAPSSLEGLHLPPAEAMMTGCPVVSTLAEMSGVRDYIVSGHSGMLSKNNPSSFLNDVEHLYNHQECRKRIGNNAITAIKDIGGRKKNMQTMIDLLGNLSDENI